MFVSQASYIRNDIKKTLSFILDIVEHRFIHLNS